MTTTNLALEIPDAEREGLSWFPLQFPMISRAMLWTPETLFISLAVVPESGDEALAALTALARDIAGKQQPFAVQVEGTGAYPSAQEPRTLWCGITEGQDDLRKLREEIASGVPSGLALEPPPGPDVVFEVGRLRESATENEKHEVTRSLTAPPIAHWKASFKAPAFTLVRSTIDGPRWSAETLERIPFGAE